MSEELERLERPRVEEMESILGNFLDEFGQVGIKDRIAYCMKYEIQPYVKISRPANLLLVTMVVPLAIVSFTMKGNVTRPVVDKNEVELTTEKERITMLVLGVAGLLFVPVFKTVFFYCCLTTL